jgi:multiple sugar transport system permease protein
MKTSRRAGLLPLVVPTFALLAAVTVVPIVLTAVVSLYYIDPTAPERTEFQGLADYVAMFGDDLFISSLYVTVELVVFPVVLQVLIGFALAVVLRERLAGTGWIRLVFLLPAVIPPSVSGLIWKLFIVPGAGGLTYLGSLAGLQLEADLLNAPTPALVTIIVASVWTGTPFVALLMLSALEAVPREQYEAAEIDGTTWLGSQRYVSLPAIAPVVRTVTVFRVLEALAIFPIIFVMTGGGPAGATEPINYYAYVNGFNYLKIDYAASLIVFFFLLLMAGCLPFLRGIARRAAA